MKHITTSDCLAVADGLVEGFFQGEPYSRKNSPTFRHVHGSEYEMSLKTGRVRHVLLVAIKEEDREKQKGNRIRFLPPRGRALEYVLIVGLLDKEHRLTHFYIEEMANLTKRISEGGSKDRRWYVRFSKAEMRTMFVNVKNPEKGLLMEQMSVRQKLIEITKEK